MTKLADLRRDFDLGELRREQLAENPLVQFERWLGEAIACKLPDPNAMTVATVDADGQPSQRIVLLKDVSERGFVFYTNTGSRKAEELAANPKVSLHFPWHAIERQVKICGIAEPLSKREVVSYFVTRPRDSQLAAWASEQSAVISSRQVLMQKFAEIKHKFAQGEVPLPSFWGGYRVKPQQIEFWQGGTSRLHNRFVYNRLQDERWQIDRLMP